MKKSILVVFGFAMLQSAFACEIKNGVYVPNDVKGAYSSQMYAGLCSNNDKAISCTQTNAYSWLCTGPTGTAIEQSSSSAINKACGC